MKIIEKFNVYANLLKIIEDNEICENTRNIVKEKLQPEIDKLRNEIFDEEKIDNILNKGLELPLEDLQHLSLILIEPKKNQHLGYFSEKRVLINNVPVNDFYTVYIYDNRIEGYTLREFDEEEIIIAKKTILNFFNFFRQNNYKNINPEIYQFAKNWHCDINNFQKSLFHYLMKNMPNLIKNYIFVLDTEDQQLLESFLGVKKFDL